MTSPAQIAANQSNAKLSTGPTTATGKETVAGNAVKHGLAGKGHAVLPGEHEAFAQHCEGYIKAWVPIGAPERDLVTNLAENYWRLKRAHAMENALFIQVMLEQSGDQDPASAQAQAWADASKGLQRIALYAGRIQRAIEKDRAELKAMQAARNAAYGKAQEEAILLTQLAQAKGQSFDPAEHFSAAESLVGFVYSAQEIARVITRASRLEEARMRFLPAA